MNNTFILNFMLMVAFLHQQYQESMSYFGMRDIEYVCILSTSRINIATDAKGKLFL